MKTGSRYVFQWFGPGLIMAAAGIGASDIITATVCGATHGVVLLWALVLGAFFKFVLTEGLARWQLATGVTVLEGWARFLPRWVLVLFVSYLVLWSITVSGALVSGCGLAIENITRGAIPRSWGAFGHALGAFVFIYAARTDRFVRVMKVLVALMFFSIVACAALTFREPIDTLEELMIPTIPAKGGAYILSLMGGIGGSLTLLSYNYLLRDEGKIEPGNLRKVRIDLAIAYVFTAVFGVSVIFIANRVFYSMGATITDREVISRMAGQLAELTGPIGFYVYSMGFWAAVVASLIGVWQTTPSIFADCHRLLMRLPQQQYDAVMRPSSKQFRTALAFMALVSVPFAFLGRPLLVVVGFTIVGSLFIPFLATTLLYLNNRVPWTTAIRHNSTATNMILVLVLLLFLAVGGMEISALF